MKRTVTFLAFLSIVAVNCTTNKYEKYFDNPSDWVVYYTRHSFDGEVVVQNVPIAVMTLNESDLSYSFHHIDQVTFQGGAYMPFSMEDTEGFYSYSLDDANLGEPTAFVCSNLRNLDEDTIIGTLTLERGKAVESEIPLSVSEVWGMQYHIQVKPLSEGKVELHLIPFMPGMIQLESWDIRKRLC